MSWSDAIVSAVKALGVPYGFTIAIWSSGALAIAKYGVPSSREVLLFAMGAMIGYLVFDSVAWTTISRDSTFAVALPSVAVLNIMPVLPALLVTWVVGHVKNRRVGFFTVGFAASFIYIGSFATLLFVVENILY